MKGMDDADAQPTALYSYRLTSAAIEGLSKCLRRRPCEVCVDDKTMLPPHAAC